MLSSTSRLFSRFSRPLVRSRAFARRPAALAAIAPRIFALPSSGARGFSNSTNNAQSSDNEHSVSPSSGAFYSFILTSSGPDRVGFVSELTAALAASGANVEESRMAILGSEFALILRMTVPAAQSPDSILARLRSDFPEFLVSGRVSAAAAAPTGPVKIRSITLEGPDQPGIVAALSNILSQHGVSVRDLDTDCFSAPFAGYRVFSLQCVIAVPANLKIEALYEDMGKFEEKFGLQITVADPQEENQGEIQEGEDGEAINGEVEDPQEMGEEEFLDDFDEDEDDEVEEEEIRPRSSNRPQGRPNDRRPQENQRPQPQPRERDNRPANQHQHQHQSDRGHRGGRDHQSGGGRGGHRGRGGQRGGGRGRGGRGGRD